MKEILRVKLENDMDLILAHKRTMKLAELTGFSLPSQTLMATAVSEIGRCAIENGNDSCLILGIELTEKKKWLQLIIRDSADILTKSQEPVSYAKRLVEEVQVVRTSRETRIILRKQLNFAGTLTDAKINSFVQYFEKELPLSPYDEIRRKNIQLQDLAEKIYQSESDYRLLTDTLPLMMFSVNSRGVITYINKWFGEYLGTSVKELKSSVWQRVLHPSDFVEFQKDINSLISNQSALNAQYRFKQRTTGNYLWHIISILPLKNELDGIAGWIGFLVDIHAQKQIEQTLKDNQELKETQGQLFQYQTELEHKVFELNRSNYELEQFAHLASHDLQEPLRKILFYSSAVNKKYEEILDPPGVSMLSSMSTAAVRMKELITDLLAYSQLQQQKITFQKVDLNEVLQETLKDLEVNIKDKEAAITFSPLPVISGNPMRLRQLFSNLIANSLKYSRKDLPPVVKIESLTDDHHVTIRLSDNGIGFDQKFSEKIFGLFERLHSRNEFPGTGIGLSICKRITELHNGKISATSKINEYSIFEVMLPFEQPAFNPA